jgi:hypothetical protein
VPALGGIVILAAPDGLLSSAADLYRRAAAASAPLFHNGFIPELVKPRSWRLVAAQLIAAEIITISQKTK